MYAPTAKTNTARRTPLGLTRRLLSCLGCVLGCLLTWLFWLTWLLLTVPGLVLLALLALAVCGAPGREERPWDNRYRGLLLEFAEDFMRSLLDCAGWLKGKLQEW
ncbi:hypothetical protein Agub_g5716 [Astrephomene gubernaculifera]|uniref:Uncharacterized protein n=1 Tax=Astrephomene gubernaculifera TaxID=47775 RepID=A0AAD3DM99_9CHLO|nr:hypothetical protein Agub_g5716 [Astrephomene gubernaculifera]